MSAVRRADHSSFSNPEEVVVRHSHFELSVDFDSKVIDGYAQVCSAELAAWQQQQFTRPSWTGALSIAIVAATCCFHNVRPSLQSSSLRYSIAVTSSEEA